MGSRKEVTLCCKDTNVHFKRRGTNRNHGRRLYERCCTNHDFCVRGVTGSKTRAGLNRADCSLDIVHIFGFGFFPVCEYQDDMGLSIAEKKNCFLKNERKKGKRVHERERERERFLIVLASLFPLLTRARLSREKNTQPIDCDCLTYLPQPLDSFFLFFPSFHLYTSRASLVSSNISARRPVQWIEI